jgi:succinate-acetate transporter protein
VLGLALAYGGAAQFCSGMWEFKRNNTFGATAFTSYGAFWLSFWALLTFYVGKISAEAVPAALGFYLLAWAIFTGYMTIPSMNLSRPVFAMFALLTITFLVLAIGAFGSNANISTIGGYLGVLTAIAAW